MVRRKFSAALLGVLRGSGAGRAVELDLFIDKGEDEEVGDDVRGDSLSTFP
jgi:hypothetical protein